MHPQEKAFAHQQRIAELEAASESSPLEETEMDQITAMQEEAANESDLSASLTPPVEAAAEEDGEDEVQEATDEEDMVRLAQHHLVYRKD